jgi:DNA-binding transcriptional ArsR family regulator
VSLSENGLPTALIVESLPPQDAEGEGKQIPWERIARAEVHELRLAIIEFLAERGTASPKQLATALGRPLSNVSYHIKGLNERGLVRLVGTEPRRGAVEHFYELRAR